MTKDAATLRWKRSLRNAIRPFRLIRDPSAQSDIALCLFFCNSKPLAHAILTLLHIIPTLEGGGAERQLSLLASELARRGNDVHVALRRTGVHAQSVAANGVTIHELGDFRRAHPGLLLSLRRVIKNVLPALVQTWLPQMDIMGGLAALQAGIPWIATERTADTFYTEIPLVARSRLFLGRFASAVVANSEVGAQYWRDNGTPTIKVSTIRNAVDFEGIRRAADRPSAPPSKPAFLVVGRLHSDKAVEIIVRAIAKLPDPHGVEVWIMGQGTERTRIEHEIKSASLCDNVKLLPYQPDWWRWMGAASGLISMSRYEGNPNAVLEAMAGLCPVILSDIPGHREIADISSALFVPVDDAQTLSTAIASLLEDTYAARLRAICASERVAAMTMTAMTDAYQVLYQDLLSRSAR